MRRDRGYWCLPEVDLGLPLTDGMHAVVGTRMPAATFADAMVTGRRFTAEEARTGGIVEHVADEGDVVSRAVELAAPMAGKDRRIIAIHKRLSFGDAAARCGWVPPEG
jgi:enoyl-CoA hydratase/carnithine racemase